MLTKNMFSAYNN